MCLYPQRIKIRRRDPDTCDWSPAQLERGYYRDFWTDGEQYQQIVVPCGHCVECSRMQSTEWAYRIVDECRKWTDNCCITLTYDPEHLPVDGQVHKRDLQLFMKRLRKSYAPQRIRFYASGEYGSLRSRPHYHVILFNFKPDDMEYHHSKNGHDFYVSRRVRDIWGQGHILVGEVDLHTAFYTAKYLQKFVGQDLDNPPFVLMSRRPGIGGDIDPTLLDTDKLYVNGRYIRLPRYYLERLKKVGYELQVKDICKARLEKGLAKAATLNPQDYFYDLNIKLARQENLIGSPILRKFYHKTIDKHLWDSV